MNLWQPFTSLDELPLDTYILFQTDQIKPWEYGVGVVSLTQNKSRYAAVGSNPYYDVNILAWKVLELNE